MQKYFLPIASIFLLTCACQKAVDADKLLDTEPKVFITGYLSPADTILRVNVSRAFSSVGTPLSVESSEANRTKFLIKDAEVSIFDEQGNSTILTYSDEDAIYMANANTLEILTNKRYFLKVVADGKEFNASCRIPEKIETLEKEVNVREDGFGGKEVIINVRFQDFAGERNYYAIGGVADVTYRSEEYGPETFSYLLFFNEDYLLTDALEDGGTLSGRSETFLGGDDFVEGELTLQVANMEEILFQNLRAIDTNDDADGNPFVEYSIAPNNIQEEGAVGVFAGYQLTEQTFDIEELLQ